jgi:hypothetical protein
VPVGTVIAYTGPENFENWLECNGQSTAGYPELAAIVGANVPNYQGMFLRGYGSQNHSKNNGSTVGVTVTTHSSGSLGAIQGDATRGFGNTVIHDRDLHEPGSSNQSGVLGSTGAFYNDTVTAIGASSIVKGDVVSRATRRTFDASRVMPTSTENRPVNMAVRYLIRAKP